MNAYRNPNVLRDMATKREWPRRVVYAGDSAHVECGYWGNEGWIGFTLTFPASELPEARVSARYVKEPA